VEDWRLQAIPPKPAPVLCHRRQHASTDNPSTAASTTRIAVLAAPRVTCPSRRKISCTGTGGGGEGRTRACRVCRRRIATATAVAAAHQNKLRSGFCFRKHELPEVVFSELPS
jgi:hypothetical protein